MTEVKRLQFFYKRETNAGQMLCRCRLQRVEGGAEDSRGGCALGCNVGSGTGRAVHILVINSGSSSIKFSLFDSGAGEPRSLAEGEVTGIGGAKAGFKFRDASGKD